MAISEARKAYLREWRAKNRAKLKDQALACYYRNHEARKAKGRARAEIARRKHGGLSLAEWYAISGRGLTDEQRRQKRSESTYRWRKAHPEKAKALDLTKSIRRRGFNARHLSEAALTKLTYYGNRCIYCGSTSDLSVDHKKPLSKNGSHLVCNLAPACRRCNSKKSNKWFGPQDWIRRRDYELSRHSNNTRDSAQLPARG